MRILLVRKENKNSDFIQLFFLFFSSVSVCTVWSVFTTVPCVYVMLLMQEPWTCIEDWHRLNSGTPDVTWTILTMSLLPFWALNVSVVLLSMQCQKALRFYQKYFNLCSEDEWRSYEFGTIWGWVINETIFTFGWTIPLNLWHIIKLVICISFC